MIKKIEYELGAYFGEAYQVNNVELEAVISLVTPAEVFDLIFHNEIVNVYRIFSQTGFSKIKEFNLTFIAELINKDAYLVTSGTIRTGEYLKEPEYEKVGKRILYNATKQLWNVKY